MRNETFFFRNKMTFPCSLWLSDTLILISSGTQLPFSFLKRKKNTNHKLSRVIYKMRGHSNDYSVIFNLRCLILFVLHFRSLKFWSEHTSHSDLIHGFDRTLHGQYEPAPYESYTEQFYEFSNRTSWAEIVSRPIISYWSLIYEKTLSR